jgi:hypothetical protein
MITDAQAETIYDIFERWRMASFMPLEVFRTRSAADTAKIRTCMALVKKGLIERVDIAAYDDRGHFRDAKGYYRLALTEQAIQVFTDYAMACDYEFSWRAH